MRQNEIMRVKNQITQDLLQLCSVIQQKYGQREW